MMMTNSCLWLWLVMDGYGWLWLPIDRPSRNVFFLSFCLSVGVLKARYQTEKKNVSLKGWWWVVRFVFEKDKRKEEMFLAQFTPLKS